MAMQVRNQRLLDLIAASLICMMLMSVSASEKSFALSEVTINGAGSTFVFPLLNTWRVAYQKVHPNVNINCQSIGSGGGASVVTPNKKCPTCKEDTSLWNECMCMWRFSV